MRYAADKRGRKYMNNEIKRNFSHKLNLQLFAEPLPTDPPADPLLDPPADPPKKLELTQEEFDAKIAERIARERKKYVDYEELKTKLSTFESAEEARRLAALSETERLQAEKDAAVKEAEDARTSASDQLTKANERIIKSEFKAMARELGVRVDALDDAFTLSDKTGVSVDDEGIVIGIKEAIDALLVAKPFLAETPVIKPKQIGGPTHIDDKAPQKTKEQLLADAAEKARKSGRIEDRAAYAALKDELNK
jgi:hypothetical protein